MTDLASILAANPDLREVNVTRKNTVPDSRVQCFFVRGVLPGMNEIVRDAKVVIPLGERKRSSAYGSKVKRQWTEAAAAAAMDAGLRPCGRVHVSLEWREPNKRRDIDNIRAGAKFVLDGLVLAGVIQGDGWGRVLSISDTFVVDKENPGVMVTLLEEKNLGR